MTLSPALPARDQFESCFQSFAKAIRPDAARMHQVLKHVDLTVAPLRRSYWPGAAAIFRGDHLVIGAFGKGTALAADLEVDLIYMLPAGERYRFNASSNPQSTLICEIRDQLALNLKNGNVRAGLDRVTVVYGELDIVVRAGFEDPEGGYHLADSSNGGSWQFSNPLAEQASIRVLDRLSHGKLTELIILLKSWRNMSDAPIAGFAIELLAREFISQWSESFTPARRSARMLTEFFAWSRHQTPGDFQAPGNEEKIQIGSAWHGYAEAAYWRAVLAERYLDKGSIDLACLEWRDVLGLAFPTIGAGDASLNDVSPDIGRLAV